MPALLIRHRGVDFDTWLQAFRKDRIVREANGALTELILRNPAAPDDVWVLIDWDDPFRADLFVKSDDLQDQLDRSGVETEPEIWVLERFDPAPPAPEGGSQSPT